MMARRSACAQAAFYLSRAAIWQAQHQLARCLEDVSQAMKVDPTWVTPVYDCAATAAKFGRIVDGVDSA